MEHFNILKNELLKLLGLKICKIGIVVWPDSDGLEETDVKLYIEFSIPEYDIIGVLFGTDADGQTPSLEFSILDNGIPFSSYETKRQEWAVPNYLENQETIYRFLFLFSLDNKDELSSLIGESLSQIYLITFSDEESLVTGIVLETSNGRRVWSTPTGTYGNQVSMDTKNHAWPAPVRLIPISVEN